MEDCNDICVITNIGTHYRLPIYTLMSRETPCDFYIGDKVRTSIKTFDYTSLKGYRKTLHNVFFHNFYWQKGSVALVMRPYKYYILDGEPFNLSSWMILLLAKLTGKKTIAWTHGWYGREGRMKTIIKKVFFKLHSKLMVYSDYAIGLMTEQGFNKDNLYCIANSLDSDREKVIRKTLTSTDIYTKHFGNNHPTVIYCGRIQKWKKLEQLVDSVKALAEKGKLLNIVFVGKDVENVNIEQYVDRQGIGKQVWMYGPCYDDIILGELFYNAAFCVSPGNVGLTAIHALSFGCPVITHDNFAYQAPEFESIRPGVTGDFFKRDDMASLERVMEQWTAISSEKREEVRKAAFSEIDAKWNIHYQIGVIKRVIDDLRR